MDEMPFVIRSFHALTVVAALSFPACVQRSCSILWCSDSSAQNLEAKDRKDRNEAETYAME